VQEDTFPWLFEGKASAWSGSLAERGWKYLRQALDLHDSTETDYKYTKAAIESILEHDRKRPLPPWIVCALDDFDPEFLIRISLRYEKHDDAVESSLSLIRKCNAKLTRDPPRNASMTWLPCTVLDQLLVTSRALARPPTRLSELEKELSDYVKRIQKLVDSRSL
jgi:nuclear pore complex protein Nup160